MSFSAEKLAGKQWVSDAKVLPELMVSQANAASPVHLSWAKKIPPVQVSQLIPLHGMQKTDPATGSFMPREVTKKWCYHFGEPEDQAGHMLNDVHLVYAAPSGPVRYHTSNEGAYTVILTLVSDRDLRRPVFRPNIDYLVELYFNDSGSRPRRLTGMGKFLTIVPGNSRWTYLCRFRLSGSFYPERNTNLKPPPPPSPQWAGAPDEPIVEVIDVMADNLFLPQRRIATRRNFGQNLGIPKRN